MNIVARNVSLPTGLVWKMRLYRNTVDEVFKMPYDNTHIAK